MTMLFEWLMSNAITASVLALLAFGVSKAWPRRPALAHACWLLVLVKLLTPPFYVFQFQIPTQSIVAQADLPISRTENQLTTSTPVDISMPLTESEVAELVTIEDTTSSVESAALPTQGVAPPVMNVSPPVSVVPEQPAATSTMSDCTNWIAAKWQMWGNAFVLGLEVIALAGTGFLIVLTIARVFRFERLLRLGKPAPADLNAMTRKIGEVLQVNQLPSVLIVPGKVGPLLWPRWQEPVIVLPEGLLDNINGDELQTVLAHELTHYRRGDHLWRYLELAAVAFYWWLPSAWWASRRLRQAEEECCDAGVVASLPDGVASYATALVRSLTFVAEPSSPCPALSSGLGPVTLLKRRLNMLQAKVERRLGIRGWLLLAAVAALALPIGISLAQDDPLPRRDPARERGRRDDDTPPDGGRSGSVAAPAKTRNADPADPFTPRSPLPPRGGDPVIMPPTLPAQVGQPGAPVPPRPGQGPDGHPSASPFGGMPPGQGMPPGMGGGMGGRSGEDMRSNFEMKVREAELDLKAKRIKVRQAESAIKLHEAELARVKRLVQSGAADSSELNQALAKIDNSRADLELAQVEVERGELAVEQTKRMMGSMSRNAQPGGMPPMSTTPAPSGPGVYAPAPGGSGRNIAPGGGGAPMSTPSLPGSGGPPVPGVPGTGSGRGGFGGGSGSGFGGGIGGPGGGGFGASAGGLGGGSGSSGGSGRAMSGAAPGSNPLQADQFYRNFDRQGTGKIRREDVPEWMRDRFFEVLDTNHDGVVDQAEFSANYSKLWETGRRGAPAAARGVGGDGRRGEGSRGEGIGRGEGGGRGEGSARAGEGRTEPTPPAASRGRGGDPRDERIEQLEQELKDMRKALEDLRSKDRPGKR